MVCVHETLEFIFELLIYLFKFNTMAAINKQALQTHLDAFKLPDSGVLLSTLPIQTHFQWEANPVRLIFFGDGPTIRMLSHHQQALKNHVLQVVRDRDVQLIFSSQAQQPSQQESPPKKRVEKIHLPHIKNIVAVASGKGGVGKSTVAVNLACALQKSGHRVGLLDLDIYGPSLPTMLGLNQEPKREGGKAIPVDYHGLPTLSVGYLIPADKAVIWRGPLVQKMVQQFLTETAWPDLDYLILDTPPGTGDVHLSLAQMVPLSGVLVVTTPQKLSLIDAEKSVEMYETLNIPVLGLIENMADVACPSCHHSFQIFDQGGGEFLSQKKQVPLLASLPLSKFIRESADSGQPFYEQSEKTFFHEGIDKIVTYFEKIL
jgi:Mrp family chromosome partitioning ATPase